LTDRLAQKREQKRELEAESAEDKIRLDESLEFVCSDMRGRYLLRHLLRAGHYGEDPFDPDPQKLSFNVGLMKQGNTLASLLIEKQPSRFMTILNPKHEEN